MGGKRTTEPFLRAYRMQKSNARTRKIQFHLTFDDWKHIWLDSGKWCQRGRGAEKYCMCRVGDSGSYELGNVFIDLGKRNVSAGNIGKPDSDETRAKKSAALTGKPHPWSAGSNSPMHRPEVKQKVIDAISGEKHYLAKVTMTPFGFFKTATEAALKMGIPKPTVNWRCKREVSGWAYI